MEEATDPEREALLADSVGLALLVLLDALTPAERVAFVLHDMFNVPFGEIASFVGRSPAAARQLASRARRRLTGSRAVRDADLSEKRAIVEAFLAASRGGDLDALVTLLDPHVVMRADQVAAALGAPNDIRSAPQVAETFSGRARVAKLALLAGTIGAVWTSGGVPRVAFDFTVEGGKIVAIDLVADAEHLRRLDVTVLGDGEPRPAASDALSP